MKRILLLVLSLSLLSQVFSSAQTGPGWETKTVADGVVCHSFAGEDPVSGAPQHVYVLDWDSSNPSCALRFTWSATQNTTSGVFRSEDAVATLNAAYEPSSIVFKTGGHYYSCMPWDTVMRNPVPNWKNEGALYADNSGRNIKLAFDGRGRTIAEQRAFYAASPWDNMLTSAPMLIDDYSPVGAFFVDSTLTAEQLAEYNYEDPVRHQGVRHPRTAVALTEDGHFLMVAVDGRRPGSSEGMSARELTRFLERHFHPQYALNLDGGGSTTLCVRGEGDPETHVVNTPSGKGERRLYSHLCLVEVPRGGGPVRLDRALSAGEDRLYEMAPKASTPAPKGYEPVYVSHYGRHGSRYAYTAKAYTVPLETLRRGAAAGNLTGRGEKLLSELETFWESAQYKVGDLTPLGWEQHRWIAAHMVKSFPSAFGKGSRVDACSSPSVRAIISMTSACTSISREAPKSEVYAHQGMLDTQATRPNAGRNPFRYEGPYFSFPYPEGMEQFWLRKFPDGTAALGRIFKDPSAALEGTGPYEFFYYYYMLTAGMQSVPEEERVDVSGLLTDEETALLWEADNYGRFYEYFPYRTACCSIVDDIVAKADARLEEGSRGADLRFGHDHVVLTLLMIMDIDSSGHLPSSADDLKDYFRSYLSPKAANIQFVFYRPKRGRSGETLVKVLLNGEETTLGNLATVDGPYYKWSAVKEYLGRRTDLLVNR